jgi:hypothetical protein
MMLLADWRKAHSHKHMMLGMIEAAEHTPSLFTDVSGRLDQTTLLDGHMDKQPGIPRWNDNKRP